MEVAKFFSSIAATALSVPVSPASKEELFSHLDELGLDHFNHFAETRVMGALASFRETFRDVHQEFLTKESAWGRDERLDPEKVAYEFCVDAGLIARLQRNIKLGLQDRTVAALLREAEELLDEVGTFHPSEREVVAVQEVFRVSEETSWKAERGEGSPYVVKLAQECAFSFLTPKEYSIAVDRDMVRGNAAASLLIARVPEDPSIRQVRDRARSSRNAH